MKKVGIVLGGGGAKGAFQIGVLEGLLDEIKTSNSQLVAISGTSIGAMAGAFIAAGQFRELKQLWLSWSREENPCPFTQTWKLGAASSLFLRGYSYNSKPVEEFFKANLNISALRNSEINYNNTRVRLKDGAVFQGGTFDKTKLQTKSEKDIIAEIMASMSPVPLAESIQVYGEECVDGGFRDTIPVKALLECNSTKFD